MSHPMSAIPTVTARIAMDTVLYEAGVNRTIQATKGLTRIIQDYGAELGQLANVALVSGAGMGVGLAMGTKAAMELENQLARVFAVGDMTAEEMIRLEGAVKQLGTGFVPAQELAKGLYNLASAGFEAAEMIEMIPVAAQLATASMISLDQASQLLVQVMRAWQLEGEEAARVANVVAASNANSSANAERLAAAFRMVSAVAAGSNLTLEETTSALNILIDVFQNGEMAGTALRGVIGQLNTANDKLREAATAAGVPINNLRPRMVGLEEATRNLAIVLNSGADAGELFETRTQAAVETLAASADRFKDMEDAITGTDQLTEQYNRQMEKTVSILTILQNTITVTAISFTEGLLPGIRLGARAMTYFAEVINAIPQPIKTLIGLIASIITKYTLLGGVLMKFATIVGKTVIAQQLLLGLKTGFAATIAATIKGYGALTTAVTTNAKAQTAYAAATAMAQAAQHSFTQALAAGAAAEEMNAARRQVAITQTALVRAAATAKETAAMAANTAGVTIMSKAHVVAYGAIKLAVKMAHAAIMRLLRSLWLLLSVPLVRWLIVGGVLLREMSQHSRALHEAMSGLRTAISEMGGTVLPMLASALSGVGQVISSVALAAVHLLAQAVNDLTFQLRMAAEVASLFGNIFSREITVSEALREYRDNVQGLQQDYVSARRALTELADQGLAEIWNRETTELTRMAEAVGMSEDEFRNASRSITQEAANIREGLEGMIFDLDPQVTQLERSLRRADDATRDRIAGLAEFAEENPLILEVDFDFEAVDDFGDSIYAILEREIEEAGERAKQLMAEAFVQDMMWQVDRDMIAAMEDGTAKILAEYEYREREIQRDRENALRSLDGHHNEIMLAEQAFMRQRQLNRERMYAELRRIEERNEQMVRDLERRVVEARVQAMPGGEARIRADAQLRLDRLREEVDGMLEVVEYGTEAYRRIVEAEAALVQIILDEMSEELRTFAEERTRAFEDAGRQFERALEGIRLRIERLGAELDDDPVVGMMQRQNEAIRENRRALQEELDAIDARVEAGTLNRVDAERQKLELIEEFGNYELMLYQKHGEEYREHLDHQEIRALQHIETLRQLDNEIAGLTLSGDYEQAEARRRNDLAALDAWYAEMQITHRDNEIEMERVTQIYYRRRRIIIETFHADERRILEEAEAAYESFASTLEQTMARIEAAIRRRRVQREGTSREQIQFDHAAELAELAAELAAELEALDAIIAEGGEKAAEAYRKRVELVQLYTDLEAEIIADHVKELAGYDRDRERDANRHIREMEESWNSFLADASDANDALLQRRRATLEMIDAMERQRIADAAGDEAAITAITEWAIDQRARANRAYHRDLAILQSVSNEQAQLAELEHQDEMLQAQADAARRREADAVRAIHQQAAAEYDALDMARRRRVEQARGDAAALAEIEQWYSDARLEIERGVVEAIIELNKDLADEIESIRASGADEVEAVMRAHLDHEIRIINRRRDLEIAALRDRKQRRIDELGDIEEFYDEYLQIVEEFLQKKTAAHERADDEITAIEGDAEQRLREHENTMADIGARAAARVTEREISAIDDPVARVQAEVQAELDAMDAAHQRRMDQFEGTAAERLMAEEVFQAERAEAAAAGADQVADAMLEAERLQERAIESARTAASQLGALAGQVREGTYAMPRVEADRVLRQRISEIEAIRDAEVQAARDSISDQNALNTALSRIRAQASNAIRAEQQQLFRDQDAYLEALSEQERQAQEAEALAALEHHHRMQGIYDDIAQERYDNEVDAAWAALEAQLAHYDREEELVLLRAGDVEEARLRIQEEYNAKRQRAAERGGQAIAAAQERAAEKERETAETLSDFLDAIATRDQERLEETALAQAEHANRVAGIYDELADLQITDPVERAEARLEAQLAALDREEDIARRRAQMEADQARADADAIEDFHERRTAQAEAASAAREAMLQIEEEFEARRIVIVARGGQAVVAARLKAEEAEQEVFEERLSALTTAVLKAQQLQEETRTALIEAFGTEKAQLQRIYNLRIANMERTRDQELRALKESLGDYEEYLYAKEQLEGAWNNRIAAERRKFLQELSDMESGHQATMQRAMEEQDQIRLQLLDQPIELARLDFRLEIEEARRRLNEQLDDLEDHAGARQAVMAAHRAWEQLQERRHHQEMQALYRERFDATFEIARSAMQREAQERQRASDAIQGAIRAEIDLLRDRNQALQDAVSRLPQVRSYFEQINQLFGGGFRDEQAERAFLERQLRVAERLFREAERANLPLQERQSLLQDLARLNERVVELGGRGVSQDFGLVRRAAGELGQAEREARDAARQMEQNERQIKLLEQALDKFEDGIADTTEGLKKLVDELRFLNDAFSFEHLNEALSDLSAFEEAAAQAREVWIAAFANILDEIEPNLRSQSEVIASTLLQLFEQNRVLDGLEVLAGELGGSIPRGIIEGMLASQIPGDPGGELVERLGVTDDVLEAIISFWESAPPFINYREKLAIPSSDKDAVENEVAETVDDIGDTATEHATAAGTAAGAGMMSAMAAGVRSGSSAVIAAVQDVMAQVRAYLPSSDAKVGPLSDLTASGGALVRTFVKGAERQDQYLARHIDSLFMGARPTAGVSSIRPLHSAGMLGGAGPTIGTLSVDGRTTQVSGPLDLSARRFLEDVRREIQMAHRGA